MTTASGELLDVLTAARGEMRAIDQDAHFDALLLGVLASKLAETEAGREAWREAVEFAVEYARELAQRRTA